MDLLLENLAEIALCVGAQFEEVYHGLGGGDSTKVRAIVIESARRLTAWEKTRKAAWSEYNWRETCEAIADALAGGRRDWIMAQVLR